MDKKNTTESFVEIRPQVTVLSVLRHLNYKPWYAIAEFIDNAIQSAINNDETLNKKNNGNYRCEITISIDTSYPGKITIIDNACGIAAKDFSRAFKTAESPEDNSGLSEFGMGMKSAACWFAKKWQVRSKAFGENIERTIKFDVDKIVKENIDHLSVSLREVNRDFHYTVVTLNDLHSIPQGRTLKKIKDHISSIYRVYIEEKKVRINFNGELLTYTTPKILKAPIFNSINIISEDKEVYLWRKEIKFSLNERIHVQGFVALRETGSTSHAGFSLFRRKRLIVGSSDETYKPEFIFKKGNSYQSQRLFGDLHIEGFDVSHTKDGFRWEQHEDDFLKKLKENIVDGKLNLLSQAENYRALPPRVKIEELANKATKNVAEHLKNDIEPVLQDAKKNMFVPDEIPDDIILNDFNISEKTVLIDDGDFNWNITLRTSTDPSCEDWVTMAKNDGENEFQLNTRSMIIELSLAHPFSLQFIGEANENIELFLRIASMCCISLVLTEDLTSQTPNYFLHNFNSLLRNAIVSHS
ncbi:ATP-binding protein [Pantoea stewartii]|uniref:ATP-binding protein n=1 Tax=Pantoea stewartii TaxID=66269 RepID=UPI002DBE373F|nr:ATP-binding protein [Pantoea stewartii]MEB6535395.1 ATP-binding protein [Pantoea stewartii]